MICTTLVGLVRHFALELHLLPNPAMSMLTTNCSQNWWITLEQQEARSCPFCFPSFGQPWFLTADPLTGISVVFAVFQAIEVQAFLRILTLSRIDLDRERLLVPPRLYAPPRWL